MSCFPRLAVRLSGSIIEGRPISAFLRLAPSLCQQPAAPSLSQTTDDQLTHFQCISVIARRELELELADL